MAKNPDWDAPVKKAQRILSIEEQDQRIFNAAHEMLADANRDFAGTRRITKRSCNSVVNRSLKKNADQSYSIRRQRALKELGHYIQLAQHNKIFSVQAENTDLLPIAHPRSTRLHDLTTSDLMHARARWITDDPQITDDTVRSVLASALVAHPATAEYEYSIARLQGLPQGTIPSYALLAALGDGNSSAARRARALKQRRDRYGRFAFMGGSMRALVKRASGIINSLTGKVVAADNDSETFDVELPDGKLVRIPSNSIENVKAILKSQQGADGYSKNPAKTSAKDPILNEEDLQVLEAPAGFTKDESWAPTEQDLDYYGTKIDLGTKFTDDAYDVIKFDSPNAAAKDKFEAAQQRESEGQNVVTEGLGKNGSLDPNLPVYMVTRRGESDGKPFAAVQSWADVQDYISQDEPKFEKGELADPTKVLNEDAQATSEEKPEAAQEGELIPAVPNLKKSDMRQYKKDLKDFEKNGGLMPLDPSKDHLVMPDGSVVDAETGEIERPAKAKATLPTQEGEAPAGYQMDPAPYTPKGAGKDVESKDYTDDPAELAQKFEKDKLDAALEDALAGNGSAQLPFEAGDEVVPAEALRDAIAELDGGKTPEITPEVKDALGTEIPEAPIAEGSDPAALPALLDGLGDAEKEDYVSTGDYSKYLPKNETSDAPEGYTELNPDPFNNDEVILPEDAPEGFSFNPVTIANDYSTEDLKKELRRAIEPGSEMPGYGLLGQQTDEGEDYIGNVPGEAIRDALQLQGEDTNKLIDDIYKEGAEQPSAQEIADAVEGENAKEEPAQPTESPAQDAQGPDADSAKAGLPADSEPSGSQGVEEAAAQGNVGEPTGPAKLSTKAGELKAGDVTADKFTVENVFSDEESEAIKPGSVWVEGYYPGHATQKTKLWNKDTEIDIFRNVEPPVKGDLPALSKPKPKEYDPEGKIYKDKELGLFVPKDAEARSKYLDAVDQYNAQLAEAQAKWDAPEGLEDWSSESTAPTSTPAKPVAVVKVPATDVQAGDIAFKKEYGAKDYEYFVVESYEGINPETGKAMVKGFYPGHESQNKEWNAGTQITVMRGATDLPTAGDKPALERPSKDDADYKAKKAEFDKAKADSAATFTPPLNPDAPEVVAAGPAPKRPTGPSFDGDKLKALVAEAKGDPAKFKELLNNETIVSIDFETDGSKDFSKQNPIQVAITKTKNGQQVEEPLVLFMNPEQPLGPFYTEAKDQDAVLKDSDGNPISDEFLAKQQSMDEAFAKVAEYLGTDPIIIMAHNSPFDVPILKKYMEQGGHSLTIDGEIDTLALARKVGKAPSGNDLKSVVSKYFPEKSDLNWHDAATDVSVLPDIMNALLDDMIKTKSGVEELDIDATKAQYAKDLEAYDAYKNNKKKVETDQAASKVVADAFAGKEIPKTSAELEDKLPKTLATSDELSSATSNPDFPTADGLNETESVLGGYVSDNWVSDPENTTNIGKVFVGEWQPGDFYKSKYGGFFEVISVTPDPDNEKNVFVKRRLLSNGKIYEGPGGEPKSWMKYGQYETWRRNSAAVEEAPETPEVEQPQLETDEAPKKEASAGKWNDYNIAQGTDGVYYAENISAADVAALRNGTLTPPNFPFFAPLGGGNNQETGEGYFFTSDGKRFWGKYGASGALVRRKNADGEYEYFMAKRSQSLSQGGGKWGAPGGAHKDQTMAKTVGATAKEEFLEEVGGDLSSLEPIYSETNMVGKEWGYETFVFEVGPNQLDGLSSKDGENTDIGWFTADQINKMGEEGKLHPDFAKSFPEIVNAIDLQETKPLDKPTPTDEITETEVTSVFDISKWKKSGGQEGSNKGAYYTDPDTGIEYYVKTPKSEKHAANEVLGGALYDEAGTKFGRAHLGVDKNGKTVLVSPILDGSNKDFAEKKNDPEFKKKAQEDFAVDAWLGNYDATGLAFDNMLTKGNDLYRVDAGGSLLFRAQGGTDKDFGPEATQIDSMRDAKTNPQAAEIFGDMTDEQIAESVKKVQAVTPEKIDELVDAAFAGDPKTGDALKETLKARREYLINRFLGGQEAPAEPAAVEAPTVDANTSVINVSDDIFDIQNQLQDAIADGKKVSFKYTDKERLVTPKSIWKNPKNGNLNLRAIDADGVEKNFTLQNFQQSDSTAAEAFTPEAPATPTPETPAAPKAEPVNEAQVVEVSPEQKAAVLDEVSNLAEKLFGSKEKTKDLLESLKGQDGANTEIIDAILADIDAPSIPQDATPEQKIESDIAEALTPDADIDETAPEGLGEIDPVALAEELKTPLTPDLIWQKVKDEYSAKTLENGHIVVGTSDDGTSVINTVVKRNADNTFSVYHRILNKETGETKIKTYSGKWHSFTALKSRVDTNIWKSAAKPKTVKNGSKPETPGSVLPAAVPTQKGAYVSADGKTPIKVGMIVKDTKTGATGKVISLKDELTTGKSKAKPEGYTYTDVAKVQWDGSKSKNWKVSSYLEIQDASGAIETPEKPKNDGEEGGGTGGTPVTPKTPDSPAPVSTPDAPQVAVPTFEGADLAGATAIKDVEDKAVAKNSVGHLSAYGANDYSDYKSFLSGEFIKDPESKNMVPGILVQNDKLNSADPELVSYGVISSQNAKTGDIEVSYFDGPLAGKKQTLKSDKVWSREKFITPEQAQELDITLDSTLFDKSKAAAKAKGEEYAKQQAIQAEKAKQKAEAAALKNKFQVNGPGFQVQTLDAADVDFSQSPTEGVPSLDAVLDEIKNANTPKAAAKGASTLVDADSIEDLDVHVGLVTDKNGEKKIRVQFTLTDWAANARVATLQDDPDVTKSKKLDIDKWKTNPDGSLTWQDTWDNSTIDSKKNGVTYTGKAGSGEFKLHRAAKGIDDVDFFKYHSSSEYAVAFHNKAEILLPENATSTDIAQAMQEFGAISQVRPATKDDIKGVIENKMIWLYGNATDGKKNFAGELRQKTLDNIKSTYGFTPDDVEIVVDPNARGRVNYYIPEAAVDKLMAETGSTPFFVHNWKGGSGNTVDWYYDMITSGGIYATANRWMNGINVSGMSSAADIKANGGNYVFMSPSTNGSSTSTSLAMYFDARKVLRRLDFYKNNSDKYGQLQSDGEDITQQLKYGGGELMFKKNLSWADINTISMPSAIRKQLIEKLTAAGETDLANMVAGKQKKKVTK